MAKHRSNEGQTLVGPAAAAPLGRRFGTVSLQYLWVLPPELVADDVTVRHDHLNALALDRRAVVPVLDHHALAPPQHHRALRSE